MQAASFDEKVENANSIVVGRVLKKEARWDAQHRWILTYTTLRVEKSFKGITPLEITIVTPGGQVGDVHQDTIGVPDFAIGSENVVFVRNSSVGPTVLYLDQGAYDLAKNDKGERMVMPVESDAVRIDAQRGIAVAPEEPRTLREFEAAVRASERRGRQNQMAALQQQREAREPKPSLWSDIADSAWIIAIAILGAVLASIPLMRRSD
jgi:hypothetical protein